jgi:oxygen-independent coproporphyrinogen III oxidase
MVDFTFGFKGTLQIVDFHEPRSAYIHVPFCAHRCGYCNFTLIAGRDDLIGDYLNALERELEQLGSPREVDTIFLGGGTPTHLSNDQTSQLFAIVRHWFPPASGCEFSVEANPLDLTDSRVQQLQHLGVNRLSIGGQSFAASKLQILERDHSPADLTTALRRSLATIHSVSNDLIFGVPHETLEQWHQDLRQTIELGPHHVSTYGLTFEQGTSFWTRRERGGLQSLDEELERQMYEAAIDTLSAAGYEHYEVSNFAKPGHRCRHNEAYWAGDSYYAAGPGAARYVGGRREMNHRSTTTWLKRVLSGESPVAESETLNPEDRAREMLVFGLRRIAGVQRADFAARAGFEIEALISQSLPKFVDQNLLSDDGASIRLTRPGLLVSDSIWPHFLNQ